MLRGRAGSSGWKHRLRRTGQSHRRRTGASVSERPAGRRVCAVHRVGPAARECVRERESKQQRLKLRAPGMHRAERRLQRPIISALARAAVHSLFFTPGFPSSGSRLPGPHKRPRASHQLQQLLARYWPARVSIAHDLWPVAVWLALSARPLCRQRFIHSQDASAPRLGHWPPGRRPGRGETGPRHGTALSSASRVVLPPQPAAVPPASRGRQQSLGLL